MNLLLDYNRINKSIKAIKLFKTKTKGKLCQKKLATNANLILFRICDVAI